LDTKDDILKKVLSDTLHKDHLGRQRMIQRWGRERNLDDEQKLNQHSTGKHGENC